MKKEELQQLQLQKLKVLLKHAYENVPYYHESFRKIGFRPTELTRLEDLHKIPVLQRSDLRYETNELLAKNIGKTEIVTCKTSGTTATPVEFYAATWTFPGTWQLNSVDTDGEDTKLDRNSYTFGSLNQTTFWTTRNTG